MTKKEDRTIEPVEQQSTDRIISFKLLQLNVHYALTHSFYALQVMEGLLQREKSTPLDRQAAAETAVDVHDAISKAAFYVNAITKGAHVDVYLKLDKLKEKIITLFKTPEPGVGGASSRASTSSDDETLAMLRSLLAAQKEDTAAAPMTVTEPPETLKQLLWYCFHVLLDALQARLQPVFDGAAHSSLRHPLRALPIGYLDKDTLLAEHEDADFDVTPYQAPNEATQALLAGFEEVTQSHLYETPSLGTVEKNVGVLLYSKDTVTLYHLTSRFRTIIVANSFEAVSGNYIYLLVEPLMAAPTREFYDLMIVKILYWLDFVTFPSPSVTFAGIKNLTYNEMKSHVNMLGKMLAFANAPTVTPTTTAEAQQQVEVFWERVV